MIEKDGFQENVICCLPRDKDSKFSDQDVIGNVKYIKTNRRT